MIKKLHEYTTEELIERLVLNRKLLETVNTQEEVTDIQRELESIDRELLRRKNEN
jgi:hypothetical protein